MSTRIIYAIVFLHLFLFSFSQNSSPYWSLAGNSNATASSKLGTTNNIPLRLLTNNAERMRIGTDGRVSIGTTSAIGKFTLQGNGTVPSSKWVSSGTPVFASFGESGVGNGDHIMSLASNTYNARTVLLFRRSRGTLAAPATVAANDFLGSLLASGYDGANFQNPASVDFFANGAPSAGNVPARISFSTGTNSGNRTERMTIMPNGNVGIGTTTPFYKLEVADKARFDSSLSVGGEFRVHKNDEGDNVQLEVSEIMSLYKPLGTVLVVDNAQEGFAIKTAGIQSRGNEGSPAISGIGQTGVYAFGDNAYGSSYGVYGSATPASTNGDPIYGVYGIVPENSEDSSFGVYGSSKGATGFGVYGINSSSLGYGVYGKGYRGVFGRTTIVGGDAVRGEASGASAFGVYGYSAASHGVYGSTGSTSAYAGYFSGNVYSTGTYNGSDKSLKKDIKDVDGAMNIIGKLNPKQYSFRQDGSYALMNLPQGNHFGLIAQDVEQVLPQIVKTTSFDIAKNSGEKENAEATEKEPIVFKAINYTELIPLMIKGMQEQQSEISRQKQINEQLLDRIDQLEKLISKFPNQGNSVSLSNALLSAATPNPTTGVTIIAYRLPQNATSPQLLVTDMKGSIIRRINLASGSNQVQLNTAALAAGTYTYSLYINGLKMDSKQLIVSR